MREGLAKKREGREQVGGEERWRSEGRKERRKGEEENEVEER